MVSRWGWRADVGLELGEQQCGVCPAEELAHRGELVGARRLWNVRGLLDSTWKRHFSSTMGT